MIALVIQNDPFRTATTTLSLMQVGFQVMAVESLQAAEAMCQIGVIDLLVAEERVNGKLTHRLLLSAERRNPNITAMVLTDKKGEDADELYLLMPAIYALLPTDADSATIKRLAIAGLSYAGESLHRALDRDENEGLFPEFEEAPALEIPGGHPLNPDAPRLHEGQTAAKISAPFQSIRTTVMH